MFWVEKRVKKEKRAFDLGPLETLAQWGQSFFEGEGGTQKKFRPTDLLKNLVKLLAYIPESKFGDFIKDLVPLWMSKAHAYQLCFAWSSSNLLLKRLLRPRDSFHIFHTDNNGWKLDTQSILTSATSFQSPFFVHTFQYNLNAEPSTISKRCLQDLLRSLGLCSFQFQSLTFLCLFV